MKEVIAVKLSFPQDLTEQQVQALGKATEQPDSQLPGYDSFRKMLSGWGYNGNFQVSYPTEELIYAATD